MSLDRYRDQKVVIATMHAKEKVIAPLLEKQLKVKCILPDNINTDQFGTFSGEVERKLSPIDTLRKKCEAAMSMTNCKLAVASEGSFGAHPFIGLTSADEEFILFKDNIHNIEVFAKKLSTNTNFGGQAVQNIQELQEFARRSIFPSHSLIIRNAQGQTAYLAKGISSKKELEQHFEVCFKEFGSAFAETDMRANHNPSRMEVIKETTSALIEKIKRFCPACECPGFDIEEFTEGLPCGACGQATKSILNSVYKCQKCGHKETVLYPKNKKFEDPMYCDYCNP